MNSVSVKELGWQPFFEQQIDVRNEGQYLPARVFAHHGSHVLFQTETGERRVPVSIIESGESSTDLSTSSVAVGDWFLLDGTTGRAVRRLERKTCLYRKAAGQTVRVQLIAANVDTVFIVSSCNQEFNLSRLERYLALILESGAAPVVVLTKSDLCDDSSKLQLSARSLHPGLIVATVDARDLMQTGVLDAWCGPGQTVAMLGSSGVGKSTLANTMCGQDIKTGNIREDDDRGRHTTTARSTHRMKSGGWLIDNPGMRELQLPACEQGVADLFDDVVSIASRCKFRNCAHQGDSGCALQAAVESGQLDQRRLTSYLKLQAEQSRNSASLSERRERERKTGQMYQKIISEKQSRRRR